MRQGPKAVGYLRVSKGIQQLGPEAQHAAIERFAAREGIQIVNVHADTGLRGARSGWLPIEKRPALMRCLADIDAGAAELLIVDVHDRLGRDLGELLDIERKVYKAGGWILSACGNGNGRNDMSMTARHFNYVVADGESRRKSARIRAAFSVKRQRGEQTGRAPYGFRPGKKGELEIDPEELQTLFAIASLRRRGFGYWALSQELARCGVYNRVGKPFGCSPLRVICERLRIVATRPAGGPFPFKHVELERPLVWETYGRALKAGQRIYPAQSRNARAPSPGQCVGFQPLDGRRFRTGQRHFDALGTR